MNMRAIDVFRSTRLRAFSFTLLPLVLLGGCGGGGGGGGGDNANKSSVQVSGTLNSSITLAAKETAAERLMAALLPKKAWAAPAGIQIDNVVAIDAKKRLTFATKSGNSFSLSLTPGNTYLIAFLNGATTQAIYMADPTQGATGWSALPIGAAASDIDLGTVAINGAVASGTTAGTSVATSLGLSAATTQALGTWGAAMNRVTNLDVDGNGTLDSQEGKYFDLMLKYEFDPQPTFSTLASSATYSDARKTLYSGYGYNFTARPYDSTFNWSGSTLNFTGSITVGGGTTYNSAIPHCYSHDVDAGTLVAGYLCGNTANGLGVSPRTPPTRTYQVVGPQTFTFTEVSSQTISATLDNVYIPSVQLTMSGGQVTNIACKWWKHDPVSNAWVQPTDAEVASIVGYMSYELALPGWLPSPRTMGTLPLTANSAISVPSQPFNPGAMRISYIDAFGYGYGFEWHD